MILCDDSIVRTTLDISDEAYYIAKAVAREQKRSLGNVVSDFITAKRAAGGELEADIPAQAGFPTFRCIRRVTTGDVADLQNR